MEDLAEDRMEKQKRASFWDDPAERTKRPRKDDDDEDMLLEVACQDDFDEAGWAEECVDGQEVAEEFNDDRTGKKLDPKKVRQAREEQLVELERRVYVEADVEECVRVTGKKPIQVRRVDVDKGFGVYRSRLVAKDFRPKNKIDDREGLFAATPAAGGREVPHHAGCDQVQARGGAEGHADRHQQGPSVCSHRWGAVRRLGARAGEGWEVYKVAVHLVRVADCCQQLGAGVLSDLGGGGICSGNCFEVHILPPSEDDQDRRTRG